MDHLQTPVYVFVTLESEEGYHRALVMCNQPQMKLLDAELHIDDAPEPSDIIWENRHISNAERTTKRWIVFVLILVLLLICSGIIFYCTTQSNKLKFKYPVVDCLNYKKEYHVNEETNVISDL